MCTKECLLIKSILGISFVLPRRHKLEPTSWFLVTCANYSNMHAIFTSMPYYYDCYALLCSTYYLLVGHEFEGKALSGEA